MINPHLFSVFDCPAPLSAESSFCPGLAHCDLPDAATALDYANQYGAIVVSQRDLTTLQRIEVAIHRRGCREENDDNQLRLSRLISRIDALREQLIPKVAAEIPDSIVQAWQEFNPTCTKTQIRLYVAIQYLDYLLVNQTLVARV